MTPKGVKFVRFKWPTIFDAIVEWSQSFYDGLKFGHACRTPAPPQSSPSVAARSPRETVESVVERTNTPRAGAVMVSTSSP